MTPTQGYVAISRRSLDLEDYIDLVRRHAAWIVAPAYAGLVISIVIAFMLPNVYVSEAVMQITPAQVSEALIPTTINQQLTERIMQMQGNIMSRTSLSNLIQSPELNLYPTERQSKPLEDVIEAMKSKDLKITISQSPQSLLTRKASAFTISFAYYQRFKAQATVQKLITRFVDENQNAQRSQQTLLKDFFGDELAQAKAALEKANEELTKFRIENEGRLPEQSQMTMTQMNSLMQQYNSINEHLNRLAQDRVQLEAHLATLKSNLDIVELMAQETPTTGLIGSPVNKQNEELVARNKQIEAAESQLAQYLQIYKETYPDIKDLRKRLGVMKRERDDLAMKQEMLLAEEAKKPKEVAKKPTNFQAAQNRQNLLGQIEQTNAALKNNETERAFKLKEQERQSKEIEDFRAKLAATSGIQAKYLDLQRDQANSTMKYQEMQKKSELTAQNGDLIQRKAGEALDVLDPPSLPVNPSKPNRFVIVGAGLVVSIVIGLALAAVQEAKDTSLKNLKDVRAYTNLPVLSSIPLLENTIMVKRKKRISYLAWSAAVILGIIAVCASLFYYYSQTATT